MRTVVLGFVVVVGLVIVGMAAGPERVEAPGVRVPWSQLQSTLANADMIAVSATVGDKFQMLSLVDPKQKVISVYRIDFATGNISLEAVRNFQYDQQLLQHNTKDPTPEQIKLMLQPPR